MLQTPQLRKRLLQDAFGVRKRIDVFLAVFEEKPVAMPLFSKPIRPS
jgi:hypothetical protein